MDIDSVIKRINRYLQKDSLGPLIVDVQNKSDMDFIVAHYQLPQNTFLSASDSDFCNHDEFPKTDTLFDRLQKDDKTFFVRELSSFCLLRGDKFLRESLIEILSLSIVGHVVFITWQCSIYLNDIARNYRNMSSRICIMSGKKTDRPKLVFTLEGGTIGTSATIKGIDRIACAVESELSNTICVETSKSKKNYPESLYVISDQKDAYEILCEKDDMTHQLDRALGSEDDWKYVMAEFNHYPSWELLIDAKIGGIRSLSNIISSYKDHAKDKEWLWLYVIGLKLFGADEDWYLKKSAMNACSVDEFIKNIYRSILKLSHDKEEFSNVYERRKAILNAIGNPDDEVISFCKIVISKERDAIYYLTDNTEQEKELIFKLLDKYGLDFDRLELYEILKTVYSNLYYYLMPYHFCNQLLDQYFQDYKYQKLINKILPEFMTVVDQQAVAREFNTILKPRCSVIEEIDRSNSQTYFTDAMGVEYLGFILSRCRELSLMAKVTVCRCELPSITSRNKEFWELFSTKQYPIRTISDIDKIKHKGKDDCDYTKTKLPIYLIKELEVIDRLLNKIKADLVQESIYSKAILISDHGASRLAVIHETENLLEMPENGIHSGRCCPKSEVDEKPESAVDADDFWVLTNYDRFKGSRKANVEVHGGATLEEVTIPIIEITYLPGKPEIILMPLDTSDFSSEIPEIKISRNKPAAIKIFSSQKLMDVSIEIEGYNYPATMLDDNFYVVKGMPEIHKAKLYYVDVLACGYKMANALPLRIRNAGMSEKSIL